MAHQIETQSYEAAEKENSQLIDLGTRRWTRAQFILVGIACVLAIVYSTRIRSTFTFADEAQYYSIAFHLLHDHAFSLTGTVPTAYRPPAFPWLLALVQVIHPGVRFAKILNLGWWLASLVWAAALARNLYGQRAATLTLVFSLAYVVELYAAGTLFPQTFTGALFLFSLWMQLVWKPKQAWIRTVLQAIVWTVLLLAVPTFLVSLFLYLAWLCWKERRIREAAIVFTVVVVSCMAWSVRNLRTMHEFAFISDVGGYNLFLGNSPATGSNTGIRVPVGDLAEELKADGGEIQRQDSYKRAAEAWILANKKSAAILYVKKLVNWFDCRLNLATKGVQSRFANIAIAVPFYFFLICAIIAPIILRASRAVAALFWLNYLGTAMFYAIFMTRIRFRLPYDYLLIILAGALVAHFASLKTPVARETASNN
jgi:hypothetical protein